MPLAQDTAKAKRTRVHVKRLPPPGPDVFLCADEVADELGIGVSTVWAKLKSGQLPPAVYVFPHAPRWQRGPLLEYVQSRAKT